MESPLPMEHAVSEPEDAIPRYMYKLAAHDRVGGGKLNQALARITELSSVHCCVAGVRRMVMNNTLPRVGQPYVPHALRASTGIDLRIARANTVLEEFRFVSCEHVAKPEIYVGGAMLKLGATTCTPVAITAIDACGEEGAQIVMHAPFAPIMWSGAEVVNSCGESCLEDFLQTEPADWIELKSRLRDMLMIFYETLRIGKFESELLEPGHELFVGPLERAGTHVMTRVGILPFMHLRAPESDVELRLIQMVTTKLFGLTGDVPEQLELFVKRNVMEKKRIAFVAKIGCQIPDKALDESILLENFDHAAHNKNMATLAMALLTLAANVDELDECISSNIAKSIQEIDYDALIDAVVQTPTSFVRKESAPQHMWLANGSLGLFTLTGAIPYPTRYRFCSSFSRRVEPTVVAAAIAQALDDASDVFCDTEATELEAIDLESDAFKQVILSSFGEITAPVSSFLVSLGTWDERVSNIGYETAAVHTHLMYANENAKAVTHDWFARVHACNSLPRIVVLAGDEYIAIVSIDGGTSELEMDTLAPVPQASVAANALKDIEFGIVSQVNSRLDTFEQVMLSRLDELRSGCVKVPQFVRKHIRRIDDEDGEEDVVVRAKALASNDSFLPNLKRKMLEYDARWPHLAEA